jgi:glucan endo-1,3-alpha-glucosidase
MNGIAHLAAIGNDFGESHYIGDVNPTQLVSGSEWYTKDCSHSGFRAALPYFIAAYKSGNPNIKPPGGNNAIAWYRTTPRGLCGKGGTVWGQGGSTLAADAVKDVISVMVIADAPTTVTVSIGGSSQEFPVTKIPVSFLQVPYNGQSGPVSVTMGGKTSTGPAISSTCPGGGKVSVQPRVKLITRFYRYLTTFSLT